MNVTSVLGKAVGIQWQGLHDQSEATLYTGLTTAVVLGHFRRGRTDKPMTITQGNIKAKLGYETTNPYYSTVQDILDKGIPSLLVLNIGTRG